MGSFLEFKNVYKAFGDKQVLHDLSLNVEKGQSLVLIGRSGTGKSVLLKGFLGLHKIDAGQIELEGQNLQHLRGNERTQFMDRIGMLFQGAALFDSLPIWQNISFRPLHQGRTDARGLALDLLDQVGLPPHVADLRPADLSGGMQKRAGLARALAGDPDILLFDEPTTGLDPISAAQINALIPRLRSQRGATSITITHDLDSARKIADRVALLHQGRICWTGTPDELDSTADPLIRQFVDGLAKGPLNQNRTNG